MSVPSPGLAVSNSVFGPAIAQPSMCVWQGPQYASGVGPVHRRRGTSPIMIVADQAVGNFVAIACERFGTKMPRRQMCIPAGVEPVGGAS